MAKFHLLDAARMGFSMDSAKLRNSRCDSLYRGRSEEEYAAIAPYLFQYDLEDDFDLWLRENAGQSWGIGLVANEPMEVVHKHFRKFLLVQAEDGQELYFRFYDPRVLRVFLPTCDPEQLKEFFGPVLEFHIEDPINQHMLVCRQNDGFLKVEKYPWNFSELNNLMN
ncbi:DUF4123 domain-containing protein [Dyadobacter jiangsuensis]|uniref:Uncharacterized protein DUF4123 n=1 Tax=Dyadobacter jiangsuensis TaxID=1591085 RepID=A0A2P8G0D6_9BACT|nr:DUF4123 domain-containing protein [Dyadobacter jiangsuensis]PSL27431.1 uncharacterized protein DUF4123 [Dyadobacter jiangsuensis]